MSKAQINNEIILLRGGVEQARVQLIQKLARDAFKLRKKKGNEQQKAKNARKADRIGAEILAIKKLKKDEITKYILTNPLNLDEILKDQNAEPLTKIMARIANHKKFSKKIAEFKSKYPNYAEFLGPGRRKKAILEWKEKKKLRKAEKEENDESSNNGSDAEASENKDESSDNESEVNDDDDANEDEEVRSDVAVKEEESEDSAEEKVITVKAKKSKKPVKGEKNKKLKVKDTVKQEKESEDSEEEDVKSKIVKLESVENSTVEKEEDSDEEDVKSNIVKLEPVENGSVKKGKSKNLLGKRKKANKEEKQSTDKDTKPDVKKKKKDTSKVISKQAIVKKFTDILKEEESKPEEKPEINSDSERSNLKIEKEVDSFFFSGDSGENYLSVALPKNNSNEEEEEYGNDRFNRKHFSRQQNDKFFNKVDKFQNNGSNNFNSNRSDSRWEGQRDNDRPYGRDKSGFNKFNGRSNDRFNDRSNNRFNGKPNDRFNNDRPNNKFNDRPNNRFNDRPNNKFGNDRNDRPNNKFGNERNDKPFKKHGKDSNEVLHPSWEAKKKQQDILKKGFQGKKIVFGDDV